MILAGEVCQDAFQNAEHAKAEKNAVQVKQGRRAGTGTVHGRRTLREEGSSIHRSYNKGKPLNCCSSSAVRRVSENADSICEQSNRETSETQEKLFSEFSMGGFLLKESIYKSYEELLLFLNAELVAKVLGVSISSVYELMHEKDFPTLRVGSRMVVPKEKFIAWVAQHAQGGSDI